MDSLPRQRQQPNDEGLDLPEGVIQHIQSFLADKPAARTSVLSRTWYLARCRRPRVFLIGYNFDEVSFWEYATNTVQRCRDLNVKVDKLELVIPFSYEVPVVDQLILDVLTLRVNDLKVCFYEMDSFYDLPAQVFANEHFTKLYLDHCKVENLISGNVRCSKLRSLSLVHVSIEDSTLKDILVGSPIIDTLSLSGELTTGLTRINASDVYNLKTLIVESGALNSPSITPEVIYGRFVNLSCMKLREVRVEDSFFTNFSYRFPNLEDLTLEGLNHDVNIQVSSNSIKRLRLQHSYVSGMLNMVKFNVPNIREFNYSGDYFPPISFTAVSEDWKSDIHLSKYDDILDLSKLREFRTSLGWSKIRLRLIVDSDIGVVPDRSLEDFYLPPVEELRYYMMRSLPRTNFFIECVLSCRPKFAYFHHQAAAIAITILYAEFIKQTKGRHETITYGMSFYYMNDLMKVSMEFFEDSLQQWQQPLRSLSVAQEIRNHRTEQIRLKLEWDSPTLEQTIIKFKEGY